MNEMLLICSSDPNNGALNLSENKDRFDIEFAEPLSIEGEPTMKILTASMFFNFPNIDATNNVLNYTWIKYSSNGVIASQGTGTVTLPVGLYSLSDIDAEISRQVRNDDTNDLTGDAISLTPNNATGKAVCTVSLPNIVNSLYDYTLNVNWTTSSLASILGFTSNVTVSQLTDKGDFVASEAANQASLNQVNAVRVHCSACTGSLVNGASSDTLCEIPIDVSPGSQLNYNPRIVPRISAPAFKTNLNRLTVKLTDEQNRSINMNGEIFTVTLLVEW